MKAYRIAFKGLLDQEMPPLHADAASVVNTTWKHNDAKLFQAVVVKHARGAEPPASVVVPPEGLTEADLLQMHVRNDVRIHDSCETVPLDDAFQGPAHVAQKLMKAASDKDPNFKFNEEQVEVIALQIWHLEHAFSVSFFLRSNFASNFVLL